MAKVLNSGNATATIDNAGQSPIDLSQYVLSFEAEWAKEALDVTALTDTAERVLAGIERHPEFSIEFWFDDGANASWAHIISIKGTVITVALTGDGSAGLSGEALLVGFTLPVQIGEYLKFTAKFRWDNTVTVA